MALPAGRSPEEDALLQKAMRLLPGGVLGGYYAPQELAFIVREARGPRLYDFSGREYIDYILSSGPLVLGHAHPAVIAAVEAQLSKGTTYFQLSEPTLALAEEICRAVPPLTPMAPITLPPAISGIPPSLGIVPGMPRMACRPPARASSHSLVGRLRAAALRAFTVAIRTLPV